MATNIFGRSRRRLTLLYTIIMVLFLAVLLFAVRSTMEWAITSEQARELLDTAHDVAEVQEYAAQHPGALPEDVPEYKSSNDRLLSTSLMTMDGS